MIVIRNCNGFSRTIDEEAWTYRNVGPAKKILQIDNVLLLVTKILIGIDSLLIFDVKDIFLSLSRGRLLHNTVIPVIPGIAGDSALHNDLLPVHELIIGGFDGRCTDCIDQFSVLGDSGLSAEYFVKGKCGYGGDDACGEVV